MNLLGSLLFGFEKQVEWDRDPGNFKFQVRWGSEKQGEKQFGRRSQMDALHAFDLRETWGPGLWATPFGVPFPHICSAFRPVLKLPLLLEIPLALLFIFLNMVLPLGCSYNSSSWVGQELSSSGSNLVIPALTLYITYSLTSRSHLSI